MSKLTLLSAAYSVAALLLPTAQASTIPTFAKAQSFTSSAPGNRIVMGDFDGDGLPDVAVYGSLYNTATQQETGYVQVKFGDGQGGFRGSPVSFQLVDASSAGIAAADVLGHGRSQLLLTANNSIQIFDWNGSGFTDTREIDLTHTEIIPTGVAVGDLTAHGSRDILVSDDFGAVGVVWISNNGKGNFGIPAAFPASGAIGSQPIIVDVNGDGFPDVVLPNGNIPFGSTNGAMGGVLLNDKNGGLGAESYYGSATLYNQTGFYTRSSGLTVADADGDGKPDLVFAVSVTDTNTFARTDYVAVAIGNGDGTFKDGKGFRVKDGVTAIDNADIDGDGRVDIVTVDYLEPGFTVTEFTGTGGSLATLSQDNFQTGGSSFASLAVGYKGTNGNFIAFNTNANPDVFEAGTFATTISNLTTYNLTLFANTTGGGVQSGLPPTRMAPLGAISPGGPIAFNVTQVSETSGLTVRVQTSMTPTNEASWTDLDDGNNGDLREAAHGKWVLPHGTTTFYPAGPAVYFRAIAAASGFNDSISPPIGPYKLSQANLSISVALTSSSDPTGALQICHVGENLIYTFNVTNLGAGKAHALVIEAPVPTFIDATSDIVAQFPKSALVIPANGHYNAVSATNNVATVSWRVADLAAGHHDSATLTIKLGPTVRTQQQLGMPNSYRVYSSANQPPMEATGYSSGASNVETTVLDPIGLTVTPSATTVEPGGLITYTLTIHNFSANTVGNAMIADPVPEFTSFVSASFVKPAAAPKHQILVNRQLLTVANPLRLIGDYPISSQPPEVQALLTISPQITMPSDHADEIVFYVGLMQPGASATVHLTVQSDFVDPSSVTDHQIENVDYTGFYTTGNETVLQAKNQDGEIVTPDQGPVTKAPSLTLLKGTLSTVVQAGDLLGVFLKAKNVGASAADDVFIQDRLPVSDVAIQPSLVTVSLNPQPVTTVSSQADLNSAVVVSGSGPSKSQNNANYFVTLSADNTLTVHGLHLEPNESVTIGYGTLVPTNTPIPATITAGASFIGAGNGSQSLQGSGAKQVLVTVPPGFPQAIPVQVTGVAQLVTPDGPNDPPALIKEPLVTSNPTATAQQLDALYKKNTNALPTVKTGNKISYIAGVQRYFLHYDNIGTATAADAHLLFALPPHTEFYRACFLTKGLVSKPGPGQSITTPARFATDNVIFNLGDLATNSGGDSIVEVLLLSDAINANGSLIAPPPPQIYAGAQPTVAMKKQDTGTTTGRLAYDGQNVPTAGVLRVAPQAVHQGDVFPVRVAVFNYGDVDMPQGSEVLIHAPTGTQIVGIKGGNIVSSNATTIDVELLFDKHFANGITVDLQATGPAGSTIQEDSCLVDIDYIGTIQPATAPIQIVSAGQDIPNTTTTTVDGAQFVTIGEVTIIPLGPSQPGVGTVLVSGPATAFGSMHDVSLLSVPGDDFTVVAGRGQNVALADAPLLGNTTAKTVLIDLAKVVGKHVATVFNGPEDNLIGPDGETFVDNNTGAPYTTVKQVLAAGGQSLIASGASSPPALGTTGAAVVGGGTATATGGGLIVTSSGGVISNDGGSIISQDGSGIISQDGSGLISEDGIGLLTDNGAAVIGFNGAGVVSQAATSLISSADSTTSLLSPAASIVAAGAGNLISNSGAPGGH